MLFKKKNTPKIDQDQLALIKNAQTRIKQKKRLYYHFILFVLGAVALILLNVVFGYKEEVKPFGVDWFVLAICIWVLLLLAHVFNVFITSRFMGKKWEEEQLAKLVAKQETRIEQMKNKLLNEEQLMAESEAYKEQQKTTEVPKVEKSQVITIIAAAAENNALGKDNDLIWHLSDDLKHFKNLTAGHHVIMGRKTFESMPKALPNRTNVVITRQTDYQPENAVVVNSLKDALDIAKDDPRPFIIGGGEIYKQALDFADQIELTRVHETFEADTFFPEINPSVWKEVANEFHPKDEKHPYDFSFLRYERV